MINLGALVKRMNQVQLVDPVFDEGAIAAALTAYYKRRRWGALPKLRVVDLTTAFEVAGISREPDPRWLDRNKRISQVSRACGGREMARAVMEASPLPLTEPFIDRAYKEYLESIPQPREWGRQVWLSNFIWDPVSPALLMGIVHREFLDMAESGLGWTFSFTDELLLVARPPVPVMSVLGHNDVDSREQLVRSIGVDRIVNETGARLIDTGSKGTRLFSLGDQYFIHMRDASHPEREFIEWVDPKIGRRGNAELCQARAFGITLKEWLSIEQEG